MGHCLDYDDFHYSAKIHPSTSVVPAAIAVAEYRGKATGKELLTAVAIGADMSTRMGLATTWRFPWHMSPLTGHYSAAAACAKILGLKPEHIVDAFGIALCQAAGSMELRWGVGSDIGGMYAAFPARSGSLSALMAEHDITGIKDSFESKGGFLNLYFGGEYKRDVLLSELGKRFEGVNTGFKPWPACAHTHPHIESVLNLMKEHNLKPGDIAEITSYVGDYTKYLCEPLEGRRKPKTGPDAKFSIPFTVAVAATKGEVKLKYYTPEGLNDKDILAMAQKVNPKIDADFNIARDLPPGKTELKTVKGEVFSQRVDHPYGHPDKPVSLDSLISKFRECAGFAIKPLPEEKLDKIIELLTHLEEVKDVSEITALLR
jgi:2-methylcitrate dehydratase PrpD